MTHIDDTLAPPEPLPDEAMHEDGSLGDSFARLTQAARTFAEAEISLLKKRGAIIGAAARSIAIFGVLAFILAFGMVVTLMIGAVLALAPLWGLGLALLAVTGAALLAILLCALGIKGQVNRIREGTR